MAPVDTTRRAHGKSLYIRRRVRSLLAPNTCLYSFRRRSIMHATYAVFYIRTCILVTVPWCQCDTLIVMVCIYVCVCLCVCRRRQSCQELMQYLTSMSTLLQQVSIDFQTVCEVFSCGNLLLSMCDLAQPAEPLQYISVGRASVQNIDHYWFDSCLQQLIFSENDCRGLVVLQCLWNLEVRLFPQVLTIFKPKPLLSSYSHCTMPQKW